MRGTLHTNYVKHFPKIKWELASISVSTVFTIKCGLSCYDVHNCIQSREHLDVDKRTAIYDD